MAFIDEALRWVADVANIPELWARGGFVIVGGLFLGWALWHLVKEVLFPIAAKTRSDLDDIFLTNIHHPLGLTAGFLGVWGGLRIIFQDPTRDLLFRNFLVTGLLVIWGVSSARLLSLLLQRATRHVGGAGVRPITPLLTRLVKVAVWIVIILTALTLWDVDITPLLASAGLIGIALAFAAQDTLGNFFAGVSIYLDQPYKVGDVIVIDPGSGAETRGQVVDVGLRSTNVLTRDDVMISVPNSIMASSRITNESDPVERYRVRVAVGVSYRSDLDQVEEILTRLMVGHPKVLAYPEPRARVRSFGDSSITWETICWITDPTDRGVVIHDLIKRIHRTFREEGVHIPFPQRDLHLVTATPALNVEAAVVHGSTTETDT